MRMYLSDYKRIAEWNRIEREQAQYRAAVASGRVASWQAWDALRRVHKPETLDKLALVHRAYVSKDAEARWLHERDTPGAFAKARAANRLLVLNAQETCRGCDGRGFCQCDPLSAEALRDAGPFARPEFD